MSASVRLGFVGLGNWGTKLAQAAQRSGAATVAAGYARTPAARQSFAEAFDCAQAASLDDLLAHDLDGVVVATPHSTHRAVIEAAAAAGRHVFVEKPLTLSVADGRAAIAAARAAGVALQVGHQRRRLAATRALKRLIDDGDLGMVHMLETNLSVPANLRPGAGWKSDPGERPLGGMTGLGVHMVDTLQYLAGRASTVSVHSRPVLAHSPLDDATMCVISYDSGPVAHLATSMVVPKVATVAVHGTSGSAWSEEDGLRLFRQGIDETSRHEVTVEPVDALAEQMAEFSAVIRGTAAPEVDGAAALEVVAVLEAALRSAERGAQVAVDEVRQDRGRRTDMRQD
ncbi:MAG TPA: Gfo/Idh/MocA family oxidoreductase [Euzebyales bacterium]|nr:Gfo/Idh/MocA family oxidoreductase [Euzebyales bacterium]